jgi:N-acetylmuramoyl-L-alanine amidase
MAFVRSGYADFAMVNAPDALTSDTVSIPFEEITDYWGRAAAAAGIPMYIIHHNQRIGEPSAGWRNDDQILRQLSAAKETPAYQGSVFNSHPALMENRLNSTANIRLFFDDQINEETLFDGLIMHAPSALSFATNDAFAIFQGTYDDNFDVFLNGEEITLNEAGNFYIEKPLNVGVNTFTLRHKGEEITYRIERRIVALHSIDSSIASGRVLEVEGGTTVTISAIAYRGATVTATLNGQSVRLNQQDTNLADAALNASYASFVGRYTVPAGRIGQAQNLGAINVSANFNGYVRSMTGASVRVIALPEPPPPPPPIEVEIKSDFDQNSAGSGEVVGTINPIRGSHETVRYVRILENNTLVFAANTTGIEHNPNFSRLPAGTRDYLRAEVGGYYTTTSGKRVSAESAVLENGTGMGENRLVVQSTGTSGGNSFFRISLDHRSSFNIRPIGLNFTTAWGGDFNVSDFDATHIIIDFDNVTSVTKLPSFEHNHVFSAGKWETVTLEGVPKFRLVLQLRQRGVYGGQFARYNADGELMLTFPVMTNSLKGMNIVIDPGHGINANGVTDPGAIGHVREFDANIAVARLLRDRLRERGANAVILPTDTTFYASRERPDYARTLHNCDLFISLHCNAVTGNSGARGQEVWYFTPFSQPLANSISASLSSYFQNHVYSDRSNRNRGAKYDYFWVTLAQDFPSVLVEMGFVTNMEDAMALGNAAHQAGAATAIADGVQRYLNRSNISYSASGTSGINPAPVESDTSAPAESDEAEPAESDTPAPVESDTPAPDEWDELDTTAAYSAYSDYSADYSA